MKTILSFVMLFLLVLSIPCARAADPEPLLGISTDDAKGTLSIEVLSTGCTKEGDFRFELTDGVLTIFRTERDACKAMPGRITLTFKLSETGLKPKSSFRLGNPLVFATSWTR